jgi:hypothetical protein
LPAEGYSVCLIFLKLFERVYAPLAAGILLPIPGDATLAHPKRSNLDRLYQRITNDLGDLVRAVRLTFSSPFNENKILVEVPHNGLNRSRGNLWQEEGFGPDCRAGTARRRGDQTAVQTIVVGCEKISARVV